MSNEPTLTDQTQIAETVAYIAIRRLQNRYADIVTRRAWAELDQIFRSDCHIVVDTTDREYSFTGPAAFSDFVAAQLEQFSFFEFVILNTVMHIDTAAGVARTRMYMQELRQGVEDGRRTDAYGVYHDRFESGPDGRWWFASRRYRSYSRTAGLESGADQEVFEVPYIPLDEL